MARDRLAAIRQQQSDNNSYTTSDSIQSSSSNNSHNNHNNYSYEDYGRNNNNNTSRNNSESEGGGGSRGYEARPSLLPRQQGSYSTVASDSSRDPYPVRDQPTKRQQENNSRSTRDEGNDYSNSSRNNSHSNGGSSSRGGARGEGLPTRPQPARQYSNSNPSSSNNGGGGGNDNRDRDYRNNSRSNTRDYEDNGRNQYERSAPKRNLQRQEESEDDRQYIPRQASQSQRPSSQKRTPSSSEYIPRSSSDYNNQPTTTTRGPSSDYSRPPIPSSSDSYSQQQPTSNRRQNSSTQDNSYSNRSPTSPTSSSSQAPYSRQSPPNSQSHSQLDPYSRSRTPPSPTSNSNSYQQQQQQSQNSPNGSGSRSRLSPTTSKSNSSNRIAPPNYNRQGSMEQDRERDVSPGRSIEDYNNNGYGNEKEKEKRPGQNRSRSNSQKAVEDRYELETRGSPSLSQSQSKGRKSVSTNGGGRNGKLGGGVPVRTIGRGDVQYENMEDFFAEISDLQDGLRETNSRVSEIQSLNLRLLSFPSSDDPAALSLVKSLGLEVQTTREYFAAIKIRIQALAQGNSDLTALILANQSEFELSHEEVGIRNVQVENLKERFKDAVQNYSTIEREVREKKRSRMERQVKIVNPGLNAMEIKGVIRDAENGGGEGGGMFSQALLQSNGQRTFAARGALKEVQSRAVELAQIESTLIELAQLFNDMANLVVEQDVHVVAIETAAVQANDDMEKGVKETKTAVVHARKSRKMRWWCFGILMAILIIAAIVIVFQVVLPLIKKNQEAAAAKA